MRIEQLKTTPDRAGRYYVRFTDGRDMRLFRQTIEDFGLYAGMELDEGTFARLQTAASQMSAKMRATRIISAASVSKKDLESRLIQKGEDPDQAKQAVRWLEDLNLLDDQKTAEQIVYSCVAKGYGLSRAKQALYSKRIPKELWDVVLAGYPDQEEKVLTFLRSRLTDASDERAVKKAVDALLRRGHSYQIIREALRKLSVESDDFLEET